MEPLTKLNVHPLAIALLDLAHRKVTGSLTLAGRSIVLRQGAVSHIEAIEGDLSFERFLEQTDYLSAERLWRIRKQANEYQLHFEDAIAKHSDLQMLIKSVRRSIWLDRLRDSLDLTWEAPVDSLPFLPYAPPSIISHRASLVFLLLDALALRAQHADDIGQFVMHHIQWTETPILSQAKLWAQLEQLDPNITVTDILYQRPAYAPKLAALIQAGQLELRPPSSYPVAPSPSRPAALSSALHTEESPKNTPASAVTTTQSLPTPPHSAFPLSFAHSSVDPEEYDLVLRPLGPVTHELNDPLEPVERELNNSNKTPKQRAELWCRAATIWQEQLVTRTEAFRCYREALAADPHNPLASHAVITLADVLGEHQLALTYAKAAVRNGTGDTRLKALRSLTKYALRIHALEEALEGSAQLVRSPGAQSEDFELAARVYAEAGTVDHVRELSDAVSHAAHGWIQHHPSRALALLSWGFRLCPTSERLTLEYCALLCDSNREAAVPIVNEWHQRTLADPTYTVTPLERDHSLGRQVFTAQAQLSPKAASEQLNKLLELWPLFADSPPFLYVIANLSSQTGNWHLMHKAADAWYQLTPLDSAASVLRLVAACKIDTNENILKAANDVLITPLLHPTAIASLETALRKLIESKDASLAIELTQRMLENIGVHRIRNLGDQGILSAMTSLAYQQGAHRLLLTLHDQEAWNASPPTRQLHLQAITDLYRETGQRGAEARSLLRRIAINNSDRAAHALLFDLYASTGRTEQLKTLWQTRIAQASTKRERWRCLLDLATLAYYRETNAQAAYGYLQQIANDRVPEGVFAAADALIVLKEPRRAIDILLQTKFEDDTNTVESHKKAASIAELHLSDVDLALDIIANGVLMTGNSSLLPTLERIALTGNKLAQVKAVYDELARQALGTHSRRAIFYRAARFFELSGDGNLALDTYVLAFEQKPLNGVILRAIHRLGAQTSPAIVASAYQLLSKHSPHEKERLWALTQASTLTHAGAERSSRPRSVTPAYSESMNLALSSPPQEHAERHITTLDQLDPVGPLVELLQTDPSDIGALRSIHRLGSSNWSPLWQVVTEILSVFDPQTHVPSGSNDHGLLDPDRIDRLIHARTDLQGLAILERIWLGANPRFRKTLSQAGLRESDRLSPLEAPIALSRAYMNANRILGTAYPLLYSHKGSDAELGVYATHPPSLIIGPHLELDEASLNFRLGSALELSRPGQVLMATLSPNEGEALLEGIVAAFGDTRQRPPNKHAALIGAELWEVMPKRDQDWIRKQLAILKEIPAYPALRHHIFASAAKAGTIVCGNLNTAITNFHYLDPSLAEVAIDTEAGFIEGCQRSMLLKELLQFATSEPYLSVRSAHAMDKPADHNMQPLQDLD